MGAVDGDLIEGNMTFAMSAFSECFAVHQATLWAELDILYR
jgi:hypothetical protein